MDPNRYDNDTDKLDDSSIDHDKSVEIDASGKQNVAPSNHANNVDNFIYIDVSFYADFEHLEKSDP